MGLVPIAGGRGCLSYVLGVKIGDLVFLRVFLGKCEVFKMSGIFRGNPGADLDPRLDAIPIRLQTMKS